MTEAQAWREIARRHAEGIHADHGLWMQVFYLYSENYTDMETRRSMMDRIQWHFENKRRGVFYVGIDMCLCALLLAMESEE